MGVGVPSRRGGQSGSNVGGSGRVQQGAGVRLAGRGAELRGQSGEKEKAQLQQSQRNYRKANKDKEAVSVITGWSSSAVAAAH